MDERQQLQRASDNVIKELLDHVKRRDPLCIIKAPPGSGKTFTLLEAVRFAPNRGDRVAVATQTNAQADEICRRLVCETGEKNSERRVKEVWRFAARETIKSDELDKRIRWVTETDDLPPGQCIVVATTAKWSLVRLQTPFDLLFVDEAWQMAWCDFMLLQQVAGRFVLIGDPGQIPPVVTIPVHRWETSPRAPHRPAPEVLSNDRDLEKVSLSLPCCRRLPADSVELVRPFYDIDFKAWARPGERFVRAKAPAKSESIDRVIDLLRTTSATVATLGTPVGGPPLEKDEEIARLAARVAVRILKRGARVAADDGGKARDLKPCDLGISATHRSMNAAVLSALPSGLRNQTGGIRVDTPERWQGLERVIMILIHPLSGVVRFSAFDLESGRLCVMASRHRSGMIIVSRDHVGNTLESHFPSAEQAVGCPDITGRGHDNHLRFWQTLAETGRIVNL